MARPCYKKVAVYAVQDFFIYRARFSYAEQAQYVERASLGREREAEESIRPEGSGLTVK